MRIAFLVVSVLTGAANAYAAANDFIRPKWLLANMKKVGVPETWLSNLGLLKAAGAVGVLIGIRVPLIGFAAAAGLVLFFVGAILTHLRSQDYRSLVIPTAFLLLAAAELSLGLYARGPVAFALLAI